MKDSVVSNEKERVAWLLANLVSASLRKEVEIGRASIAVGANDADDAAVIELREPVDLVVATDYVRGPKFFLYERGHLTLRDLGWFCVVANLSDIAAMGATALGFLTVVRYPSDLDDHGFEEVLGGVDDACVAHDVSLLGGDTGSAERLILSGTAIGACRNRRALLRSSAAPEDIVVVTGPVGGAGAAVLAEATGVANALTATQWADLIRCWTGPRAHLRVGEVLSSSTYRIACQDVSDGLRATLEELSVRSSVSIVVDADTIPMLPGTQEVARRLEIPEVALAMSASTDFCLVFTCTSKEYSALEPRLRAVDASPVTIGHCEPGKGV